VFKKEGCLTKRVKGGAGNSIGGHRRQSGKSVLRFEGDVKGKRDKRAPARGKKEKGSERRVAGWGKGGL